MAMITLTNVGASYDTIAASRGLGMQRIDLTGVTQIILDVYVNKIGTGRQDWQLWNETDQQEIGVIADGGGSGIKFLSGTFNVNLTGQKVVRIRARSTVSADDPVFYDASIMTL